MIEAIAGIQEEPDAAAAAQREAREEAGLELTSLEHVATTWTMPGISTEQMTLYLATYRHSDAIKQHGGRAGEHEDIALVELKLAELDRLLQSGQIADMKTLVRHAELFA